MSVGKNRYRIAYSGTVPEPRGTLVFTCLHSLDSNQRPVLEQSTRSLLWTGQTHGFTDMPTFSDLPFARFVL